MSEAYDQMMAYLEEDEGAFPMIARCSQRQWAGLTPLERNSLERMWVAGRVPMLRSLYEKATTVPIWYVTRPARFPLMLLSVKCD